MAMRRVLRSKLHGATVTQADLHYEGSITIPPHLMELADLVPYEAVHVWNVTNGNRLETYVITGEENSSDICINGAAAHLMNPGDTVIIGCFMYLAETELADFEPKLVFLDADNNVKALRKEVPGPRTPAQNQVLTC